MITAHILRVFTNIHGNFGDKASVVIDEAKQIPDAQRQALAHKLNTGETIFVNDIDNANISFMHPQGEINFAGVGALGTAWLLSKLYNKPITMLHGRDGNITTWQKDNITWVRTKVNALPTWNIKQLDSDSEVENISVHETAALEHTIMWAWADKDKSIIRARTFATDWDIPEAQGNGSGAMLLAKLLNRSIEIKHGKGSIIFAKPASNNSAEIGGRIIQEPRITLNI